MEVTELAGPLCGATRPGHFRGVTTVVSKLLHAAKPHVAVFGAEDYQQLAVIRKLARDLMIPVEVIGAPTVREDDGLAKSSRNGYLSEQERGIAPVVFRTLRHTADQLAQGRTDYSILEQEARDALSEAGLRPDYFNIVNSLTLKPASKDDRELTLLVAAFLGTTRLIDNLSITR
ncbi:4-phosphopantoate--beta-alanine ligase [Alteromonas abrolhosensis]|uniref:4-phosphopantoate--beta-alanine ligase n=1 Tax=Alteromonas abrolhosensis TaxID=1892904 RepID=UPI003BAA8279